MIELHEGPGLRGPRFYITARLVFMVAAPAPLVFGFAPGTTTTQRMLYGIGLGLIELGGMLLLALWDGGAVLNGPLMSVVPVVDVAGLTMMGFVARASVPDPLYPAFVGASALYALLLPKRRALAFGVAAGLGYAVSMVWQQQWQYYEVLVFIERVVAIPAITWIVASASEMQRKRVEQLELVAGVAETLHSSLDEEFLPAETLRALTDVLGVEEWQLSVVDAEARELLFESRVGPDARYARLLVDRTTEGSGACGLDEAGHLEESTVRSFGGIDAVLCAPEGTVERLSREDRIVLEAVCRELLVEVANRRLFGETKHLSVTDALTGLYNRRHLECRTIEEIGRCKRYGGSVALLMIDGDDFKRVNDEHGHAAGDDVLAELAALMRASVRSMDVVARFGGEEFCILLPETDAQGAVSTAEKIRTAVETHPFAHGVCLTVSVGVASFPECANTAENLRRCADNAMYAAKTGGKSRVCVHEARADFAS